MTVRIVKAVQTCTACPSQWDSWTDDGKYLYLRFRHGFGTAIWYPSGSVSHLDNSVRIAQFEDVDPYAGSIGLEDFCARAGLALALKEGT